MSANRILAGIFIVVALLVTFDQAMRKAQLDECRASDEVACPVGLILFKD